MSDRELEFIVTSPSDRIKELAKGFLLSFFAAFSSELTKPLLIEVWSSSKDILQQLSLNIVEGMQFTCTGKIKYIDDLAIVTVSTDYGHMIGPINKNCLTARYTSLLIRDIRNVVNNLNNPFKKHLAEYPLRNGRLLESLCKIGASGGIYGKHHSFPGGLLIHIHEMLTLLKSEILSEDDYETMVVLIMLHDIGKCLTFDIDDPTKIVSKQSQSCHHHANNLIILTDAVRGYPETNEFHDSDLLKTLKSVLANITTDPKNSYGKFHDLLRRLDRLSAISGELDKSMVRKFPQNSQETTNA